MPYQNLLLDKKDGVALLTVNRPKVLNSLNEEVLDELLHAFEVLDLDRSVRAVVLTGAGEKAFVAGADIAAMADYNVEQALAFAKKGQQLMALIGRVRKPVIAAVNGFALGGGLELALACDFAYASDNAKLGLPEVTLGIMPGFGGTQNLPRLVGRYRANELIFLGKVVNAVEAKSWGLVMAVFPPERLLDEALETAAKIAGNGVIGVARAKDAVKSGLDMSLADGMNHEAVSFASLFASQDQKEGMTAFVQKRKPAFVGA
ncbi:enoyl-CoA hydratase/isomerase family protein [Geomonas subterranea]|uniref:Enoyl-CoA hydratase/isomerase family protein n=1 Tax=Geomonas subterranea TaxID=2847989 RepID=A0ABX8LH95_9BACT|nr:enoyl-CoA hydratase-related protein [Geomonas subterranea]QXE91342.1 enoyl-CoA hydratase/isomerase family protein [Geomonas subterranea]QXM10571.1 enoyl-CoA hydratase/isomerase family protein [Geomonas subterranea]